MFVNICEQLGRDLAEASNLCQSLLDQVNTYEAEVSTIPLGLMKTSLKVMRSKVAAIMASLIRAHDGKGAVFITMDEHNLFIYWNDRELSDNEKELLAPKGAKILVPEIFYRMIDDLTAGLESGKWAEAARFQNQYRRCVDYEFSKIKRFPIPIVGSFPIQIRPGGNTG